LFCFFFLDMPLSSFCRILARLPGLGYTALWRILSFHELKGLRMERVRLGIGLAILSSFYGMQAVRDYRYDRCPHCANQMAYQDSFDDDDMDVGFFGHMRAMGRRMRESMRRFDQELEELFGSSAHYYQPDGMSGVVLSAVQENGQVALSGAIELDEKQLKKLRGRLSEEDTTLTVSLPDGAITLTIRRMPGGTQLVYGMTSEHQDIAERYDDDMRWDLPDKRMRRGRARDRFSDRRRQERPRKAFSKRESYAASSGSMRVSGVLSLDKAKITYHKKEKRLIITIPVTAIESVGNVIMPEIQG